MNIASVNRLIAREYQNNTASNTIGKVLESEINIYPLSNDFCVTLSKVDACCWWPSSITVKVVTAARSWNEMAAAISYLQACPPRMSFHRLLEMVALQGMKPWIPQISKFQWRFKGQVNRQLPENRWQVSVLTAWCHLRSLSELMSRQICVAEKVLGTRDLFVVYFTTTSTQRTEEEQYVVNFVIEVAKYMFNKFNLMF